jgi:hypothetical protein
MARMIDLAELAQRDGRYASDGFRFVAEALGRAADLYGKRQQHGAARPPEATRCRGARRARAPTRFGRGIRLHGSGSMAGRDFA